MTTLKGEGTEVELVPIDDDFDVAELITAIDAGADDIERGDYIDGFEMIAQMKVRLEAVEAPKGRTPKL